jgi:hypothetical protein
MDVHKNTNGKNLEGKTRTFEQLLVPVTIDFGTENLNWLRK